MKKGRILVLGVVLAGVVTLGVTSLVAQTTSQRDRDRSGQFRARVLTLDGRGPQIGVIVEDLEAEGLKAAGGASGGVRITEVEQGSAAADAGLREGDIVVEVDGENVRSARQFARLIQETPAGRSVTLGIVRGGERQSVEVTPEARAFDFSGVERQVERRLREIEPRLRKLEPRLRELEPWLREFRLRPYFDWMPRPTSPRARLGVQVQPLTGQLAEYFGATDGGVLVSAVTADSAAERAGLRAGDVIVSVDGERVRNTDDLVDRLRDKEGEVTLGVVRDKQELSLKATLESSPRRPFRRPA